MLATIFLIVNALWNFDSSQWNIKNYTIKDGLNSNRVYTMVKDHRGRYWIASNSGLAYFDGYQFNYLTSENGIKNIDIVGLTYFNRHLTTHSVSMLEVVKIDKLGSKLRTNTTIYSVPQNFGEYIYNDIYVQYYYDSFILIQGLSFTKGKIKWPYYNDILNQVKSLKSSNPLLNDSFPPFYTQSNRFYGYKDSLYLISSNGVMLPYCKLAFNAPGTSVLDSNYIFLNEQVKHQSYIQNIKTNKLRSLFNGLQLLRFSKYQNNGFFLTTYKNGIFLYTLKDYQKKNLSNFNYNSFYKSANLLNEKSNLEIDPAIKKTGQLYQFYNGKKWVTCNITIKSLIKLDKQNFILGRRDGTHFFNVKADQSKSPKLIDSSWVLRLKKLENKLFILTYDNFKLLEGKTKKIFKLKYKGGYVLVNDLEYFNNQYVLGTNDQGVFISDTGFKKFKHISESEGLQSKLVKRVKSDINGNIWVLNDKGVDRINKDLTVTRVFSIAEIDDYDIENFSVSKDSLWLFANNSVYSINYANRFKEKNIPIVLNTLTVDNTQTYYEGDSLISIGPRWERIKINYAGIYLHEQEYIAYRYRIVYNGDSSSWQTTKLNNLDLVALRPGHYELLIEAYHSIYPNIKSKQLNVQFYIKPYFYQTWWFYGLTTLMILGSILGFLWYRNQLRLKALKLEAELNKYRLSGLQNQMNPHFVFNSMSTIQNLILNNDKEDALNFISDFSTLMRTMLQNSRNDQISLINELDFLQKYIDLEKIRYRNSFNFKIELTVDAFELEDIYIPTMMVQPLLENAVKHGVSNLSDRPGLIVLKLTQDETNESLLIIQIKDNGHGQSTHGLKNHSSTALKVIKERLAIYSKHGIFGSLDIQYTPEGTICTLKLPI